jgi:hypothetical protein
MSSRKEVVIHVVEIHGTEFKPDYLKIMKGQYVEWRVSNRNIQDDLGKPKTHIIGFNDGAQRVESHPIRRGSKQDSFKWLFKFGKRLGNPLLRPMTEKEEPANLNLIVEYNCEIYSRMKGRIEVIDPQ